MDFLRYTLDLRSDIGSMHNCSIMVIRAEIRYFLDVTNGTLVYSALSLCKKCTDNNILIIIIVIISKELYL